MISNWPIRRVVFWVITIAFIVWIVQNGLVQ